MFEKKPATNQRVQTLPRRRVQQTGTVPQSKDDIDQEKWKIGSPGSSRTRRSRSMRLPGKKKPPSSPVNAHRMQQTPTASSWINGQPEESSINDFNSINRRIVENKGSPRTSSRGDITPTPSPPDSPANQPSAIAPAASTASHHLQMDKPRAQGTLQNGPSSPKQPPTILPKPSRSQKSLVTSPPSPPWVQAAAARRNNNHSLPSPRPKPASPAAVAQKSQQTSSPSHPQSSGQKSNTSFSDAESHILKTPNTLDLRSGVAYTIPCATVSIKVTSSKSNNPVTVNTPKAIVIKVKPN